MLPHVKTAIDVLEGIALTPSADTGIRLRACELLLALANDDRVSATARAGRSKAVRS